MLQKGLRGCRLFLLEWAFGKGEVAKRNDEEQKNNPAQLPDCSVSEGKPFAYAETSAGTVLLFIFACLAKAKPREMWPARVASQYTGISTKGKVKPTI